MNSEAENMIGVVMRSSKVVHEMNISMRSIIETQHSIVKECSAVEDKVRTGLGRFIKYVSIDKLAISSASTHCPMGHLAYVILYFSIISLARGPIGQ